MSWRSSLGLSGSSLNCAANDCSCNSLAGQTLAKEGHHRIQLRTDIFATNILYQEVFCSSVSSISRLIEQALHAAAAHTSMHVFIVIMVTLTSFLRKSGPVITGPT